MHTLLLSSFMLLGCTGPTNPATNDEVETSDSTNETSDSTNETSDPTSETSDSTSETSDPTSETSDPTGETSDPTGDPDAWVLARGVAILEVEANQATRVPIGLADGAWVDLDAREIALIGGRATMLRVHYTLARGFEAHELTARLRVEREGGELLELDDTLLVTGDSNPADSATTFDFVLDAEWSEPGSTYHVELLERAADQQLELPELAATNPSAGPMPLGFEPDAMALDIVVVPVELVDLPDLATPTIDAEQLDTLAAGLLARLPVEHVDVTLGEPFVWEGGPIYFWMVQAMAAAKVDEAFHVYVVNCEGNCPHTGGYTLEVDDPANYRVSIVEATSLNPDTMVTALGLNLGQTPSACGAFEMFYEFDDNPMYPYGDGRLGSWGADVSTGQIYSPDETFDVMTLCDPRWISDYTYRGFADRIRILSTP